MNTTQMVDFIGQVRDQIKALEAQEAEARERLLELGVGDHEGQRYVAKVISSERSTVDWKAVAAKFKPSVQLVTAHTKTAVIQSVRVSVSKATALSLVA